MMWLLLLIYASILFFIGSTIAKAIKYSRMPVHLRCELYPIAHEVGRESAGTYLEELSTEKNLRHSTLGELKYIAKEMFLFQKCFYNNRALWYFTYPFHIGLFLLILWLILIFSGALMMIFGINFGESANISIKILNYVSLGVGILGIILGIFGCVGLIIKRSMDKKYKIYTTFRDYFSLLFIFAVLLNGLICWISYYPLNNVARQLMKSIITFSPGIILNASLSIGLILLSLLLFYLPFTPMMHFLGKYFTYHKVVWDNERKFKGTRLEGKLQKQLLQPISWAAPHAKPYKTWEEVIFDHKEIK